MSPSLQEISRDTSWGLAISNEYVCLNANKIPPHQEKASNATDKIQLIIDIKSIATETYV